MIFLSIEQENEAANHAFDVLKALPGWVAVQERLSRGNLRHSRTSHKLSTAASRRREALRHFTFQAITYLDLVSSSETADAFCNLLPLMVREAYTYFCGAPPQIARPVSDDALEFERQIEFRFRRWMHRAYQRAQSADQLGGQPTAHGRKLGSAEVHGLPTGTSDKGNLDILSTNGKLKTAVTLDVARRYGGVSRRAIEKAAKKGSLETAGEGPNRRIVVKSLVKYFPPEDTAN